MYVVSTCKHYVCTWIFHSSLLVLHLNMLLANSVGDNYFNYLETK
ncbi:unknown [Prevotella sp. CAG:255]|nr:unknown [Prevotella sp. CAG:255]